MLVLANIGSATALLESIATSLVAGTVVAVFLAAVVSVLGGRKRGEWDANALATTFWGGVSGCFCLLYDLLAR